MDRPLTPSTVPRRAALVALLAAAVLALGACGSSDTGGSGTPADPLQVATAFYPLQWMAEQVGGSRVEVTSLTKAGAEPHDLELSPRDVGTVSDAAVVAYLSGFQPAVDTAVRDVGGDHVFDAREAADLDLTFTPIEDGSTHRGDAGAIDPHFWLDPTRMADVATAFAETLAAADPAHADAYRRNADALGVRLRALDAEMEAGLADCERTDLVTTHNAFGYLARRYGLEQVGITGLTPEEEPSPKDLAAVADYVDAHDVTTIYFETLTSPAVAEAVASETGVATAVLDPIEGLTDESAGSDYLEIMRANLRALRAGQGCP